MSAPPDARRSLSPRTRVQRLRRALRYRLLIPLMRSRHDPEYSARGTLVGLALAFTPTIGIQMPAVFVIWLLARHVFRWDFNLVLAFAWTWLSNFFTALPFYYLFYLTGQVMLGRWHDLSGYQSFLLLWDSAFTADQSLFDQIATMTRVLLEGWGLAMGVGSLPWAALAGGLGYRYSLKFVRAHRKARHHRMARHRIDRSPPA